MKKIAITGPESCGKTSLAEALANHCNVDFIPEFAREYLLKKNGKYSYEDLEIIAEGQIKSIENFKGDFLISDTEMSVMYIWSKVVFGKVSSFIAEELKKQHFDLYILCDTDVPWHYDPLRENEHDREELFHLYYKLLRDLKVNFIIVRGDEKTRLQQAISAIEKL